jgi:hypothetical protein
LKETVMTNPKTAATDGTADLHAMREQVSFWTDRYYARHAEHPDFTVLVGHHTYGEIRRLRLLPDDAFRNDSDGRLTMFGQPVLRSGDIPHSGWRIVLNTDCEG